MPPLTSPQAHCRPRFLAPSLGALLAVLLLPGCGREEVAVYEVPKDPSPPLAASPHGAGAPAPGMMAGLPDAKPGLKWKELPSGWASTGPKGMRVANFSLPGPGGAGGGAELAVIPLPGTGGGDLDLVNLWRSQLNLAPITEEQLGSHTDPGTVGGQAYKLFSIVGSGAADASAAGNQILVAAIRKEGFTWFFKLSGDAASVDANREPLKGFLAGVEFTAPAVPPMGMAGAGQAAPSPSPAGGSEPKPTWTVPPAWTSIPPTQMVHSKWTVTGPNAGVAEVAVSVFPGEAGGMVANLNRWRAKVGLAPAPDAELQPLADNLDVLGGKGTLVDFVGTDPEGSGPSRLMGVIVRRDGWSWYYRFTGAPAVIEAQRDAFIAFVQTARYSRAI